MSIAIILSLTCHFKSGGVSDYLFVEFTCVQIYNHTWGASSGHNWAWHRWQDPELAANVIMRWKWQYWGKMATTSSYTFSLQSDFDSTSIKRRNLRCLPLKLNRLVTMAETTLCDSRGLVRKAIQLTFGSPGICPRWDHTVRMSGPAQAAPAPLLLWPQPPCDHSPERSPSQPELPSWPLPKYQPPETVQGDKIMVLD